MSKNFIVALGGKFAGEGFVRLKGCTESEAANVACKQDLVCAIEVEDHESAMSDILDLFKPLNVNGSVFKEIIVKSFGIVIGKESTEKVRGSMSEGNDVILSAAETASLLEESTTPSMQNEATEKVIDEAEEECDDSDDGKTEIPDSPFTEIRDISAAAPPARKARVAKKTMVELVAEGTIKAGDTLRVKKSPGVTIPGSEGKVIDGKHIDYKGEAMTFNAWVESIAGTRGATPYMYGIVEDGRSIEQVRNGVSAEEARAKRERRSSKKGKKSSAESEKEGSADADPEPARPGTAPVPATRIPNGSEEIHEMAMNEFNVVSEMRNHGRFIDDVNSIPPLPLAVVDGILLNGLHALGVECAGRNATVIHAPEFAPLLAVAGSRVTCATRLACGKMQAFMEHSLPDHEYSTIDEAIEKGNSDIVIFNSLTKGDPKINSFLFDLDDARDMIGRGRNGTIAFICHERWRRENSMLGFHFDRICMHSEKDGMDNFGIGMKYDTVIAHRSRSGERPGRTKIIDAANGEEYSLNMKIRKGLTIQDAIDNGGRINDGESE